MGKKSIFLILALATVSFLVVSSMESSRQATAFPLDEKEAVNLGPLMQQPAPPNVPFAACDVLRDNCGPVTPGGESVCIADGAYNSLEGTLFFVDVPSGSDGIFQVDPATCSKITASYYTVNSGVSQRGIGYDAQFHNVWVGGWNDGWLNQLSADPPYGTIENSYLGIPIASIAVDPVNRLLFIGTNENPDKLYVYDVTIGDLGDLLGVWSVPWQSESDGYDMAGMAFDNDSGQLVMINQYGGGVAPCSREAFDFDLENGLTGAGSCTLDNTEYAWGLALVHDGDPEPNTFTAYCPDIAPFAPPFDLDEYGNQPFDMCFKDQYNNEYWFNVNIAEHYIYGEVISMQGCDTPIYYLQGSFYFTNSGIEFQFSAANPLGDADYCVPAYMLKGKKVGPDWQFMWYYPDEASGSQPAVLVPCGSDVPTPGTGRGMLK